jgi:hypothetical protein
MAMAAHDIVQLQRCYLSRGALISHKTVRSDRRHVPFTDTGDVCCEYTFADLHYFQPRARAGRSASSARGWHASFANRGESSPANDGFWNSSATRPLMRAATTRNYITLNKQR